MKKFLILLLLTACGGQTDVSSTIKTQEKPAVYLAQFFSSNGKLLINNLPANSHIWANFWKVENSIAQKRATEFFTISWLPVGGRLHLGMPVKKGQNYTAGETYDFVKNRKVLNSPIYEVKAAFFEAAKTRFEELNNGAKSGMVFYHINPSQEERARIILGKRDGITNCIHAVSDIGVHLGKKFLNTDVHYGVSALKDVLEYFREFFLKETTGEYDKALLGK